jgi:hypothetical protein
MLSDSPFIGKTSFLRKCLEIDWKNHLRQLRHLQLLPLVSTNLAAGLWVIWVLGEGVELAFLLNKVEILQKSLCHPPHHHHSLDHHSQCGASF